MKYIKTMSGTDCGHTRTHQAGMLVPKKDPNLLNFLPRLDLSIENPEATFSCVDPVGKKWQFRYIYYNKKLFGTGTRNEYRITGMTKFIKKFEIQPGDELIFSLQSQGLYAVEINHKDMGEDLGTVVLRGWRQVF